MTNSRDNSVRGASRRQFVTLTGAAGVAAALPVNLATLTPAHAAGKTLRVRLGSDISVLDPAQIFQLENQTVAGHVFNGLVKYDQATNKIVPDLATSWEMSDGGKAITFKLRQGVKFHKGYGPCTSADIKFTLDRVLDPKTASKYRGQLDGLKRIEAPDDQTVRIILETPNAGLLHKLTAFNQGWIVSKKAITEMGDKAKLDPVGTGPFVFEKWTAGSEVRLSANKEYFEGAPKFDTLILRVIKDETAAAIALEKKEIDIFFSLQQPQIIDRLQKAPSIKVLSREANHTINLVLNTTAKPLGDVRVRRAIAHGMNRKALIEGFFKGTKAEGVSVLTTSFAEYTDDLPKYPYDPDKAKALLKDAGATSFKFEITSVGLSPYDKLVVPLANDLNQIGIQTSIRILERGAYTQARNSGNVMSCVTGVVGPPDPDSPLVTLYASKSFPPGMNTARYKDADDLLAKASAATGEAERKAAYKAILQKTMTDLPVIPLYADRLFLAHTDAVEGLVQNSLFTVQTYPVSLKG
ncbi:MAG: ABC transporter substrate-binding protein [Hyphomicrobiaceae bacterium]